MPLKKAQSVSRHIKCNVRGTGPIRTVKSIRQTGRTGMGQTTHLRGTLKAALSSEQDRMEPIFEGDIGSFLNGMDDCGEGEDGEQWVDVPFPEDVFKTFEGRRK